MLFHLGDDAVSWAELLGFVTGGAGVFLTVAPFWDALTTSLSLAGQYLLNTKKIENWAFWMAADVVYIPLYFTKQLDLTGLVYILFLALCVAGLQAWRRAYRDASRVQSLSNVYRFPVEAR